MRSKTGLSRLYRLLWPTLRLKNKESTQSTVSHLKGVVINQVA